MTVSATPKPHPWAPGVIVGAYDAIATDVMRREGRKPKGLTAVATGTVASDGSLSIAGLTAGTTYALAGATDNLDSFNPVNKTATLTVGAGNSGLLFSGKVPGQAGHLISVALVDPAGNNAALGVVVTGNAIVVNLATGAGGAITSTAATVLAAIRASLAANALVDVAYVGDGTGVVVAAAAAKLANGGGAWAWELASV